VETPRTILDCIGSTRLLPRRHVTAPNGARILLKLESENPTGGSTGVSLSLVCAAKRYKLHILNSDAFSQEKLDHMLILGATPHIIPSNSGRMTEKVTRDMVEATRVPSCAIAA